MATKASEKQIEFKANGITLDETQVIIDAARRKAEEIGVQ